MGYALPIWISNKEPDLLARIDLAVKLTGVKSRNRFITEAVKHSLDSLSPEIKRDIEFELLIEQRKTRIDQDEKNVILESSFDDEFWKE